jgi:hypothetical protein
MLERYRVPSLTCRSALQIAYIPQTPVQSYLSLTLRRLNFSVFDSNMLSIPSAVLQIILMLTLAKSSEYFNERTFHCFIGEFWSLPLLAALLALPARGHAWGRFALTTMISGCKLHHFIALGAFWNPPAGNCFFFRAIPHTSSIYNDVLC